MAAAAAAAVAARCGGGLLISSALCRRRILSPIGGSGRGGFFLRSNGDKAVMRPCRLRLRLNSSSSSSLYPDPEGRRRVSSSSSASIRTETEAEGNVSPPPPPPSDEDPLKAAVDQDPVKVAAGLLDIRVGRVLRAWAHPEADSLYVEEVDVGEAEPRTICSGLVNYIPLQHLQDSRVVVLANLKPRNMRGVKSNGMLMAASDASHKTVELLVPPEGSVPGERIWFGTEEEKDKQPDAASPNQVQKKKIWETVQPHLKTSDTCVASLGVHPMQTSAGVVACTSLKNANVS